VAVELTSGEFEFQYHGPQLGTSDNWLEVTRCEDKLSHRFGPGHDSELLWRAYAHAEKSWDETPFPTFRELKEPEFKQAELEDYSWETVRKLPPEAKQKAGWNSNHWLSTADGFLGFPGPVANHNKGLGADPGDRAKVTPEEYEVLRKTPWTQRVATLTELRANPKTENTSD
jgi:hypothetical protein